MKPRLWLLVFLLSQVLVSCEKNLSNLAPKNLHGGDDNNGRKALKISIISDIHYMHPSLLVNNGAAGIAFQNYLDQDPKLVQYSDPIFRTVMEDVKKEKPGYTAHHR